MMKIKPKKWWWLLIPSKRKIIRAAEFWINQESISAQARLEFVNHLMATNTPMHIFPHFDFKSLQDEVDYIASIDDDYWKE